jgi:hypothetical protein
MVLRRYQNEPGFYLNQLRLRRMRKGLQDTDNRGVGGDNANSNRSDYGGAQNKRHEERDHNQSPEFFLNSTFS